jgi:hypothetical protein
MSLKKNVKNAHPQTTTEEDTARVRTMILDDYRKETHHLRISHGSAHGIIQG